MPRAQPPADPEHGGLVQLGGPGDPQRLRVPGTVGGNGGQTSLELLPIQR